MPNINDMISRDQAQYNVCGTRVDIKKLRGVVDECIRIVDEYDDDAETGKELAHALYDLLPNDDRMFVQGELRERKYKSFSGRMVQYWNAFRWYLDA